MYTFAKLGVNGRVIDLVAVADADTQDADNNFDENIGKQFLTNLTGWALWAADKCDDLPNRKGYAAIGEVFDEDNDAFMPKKPFNSWVLNETTYEYEAPIAHPEPDNIGESKWQWDEANTKWIHSVTLEEVTE